MNYVLGQIVEERPGQVCVVTNVEHDGWCKRRSDRCCVGEIKVEWISHEEYEKRFRTPKPLQ